MKRNLKLKVFIGSDMELKFLEANGQTGMDVAISSEETEKLKYFLGSLINLKPSPESEIPPRLLSVLGVHNYGDYFFLIFLNEFKQN